MHDIEFDYIYIIDMSLISQAKEILTEAFQQKVIESMDKMNEEGQIKLANQVIELNKVYPGGLKEYVIRSRVLLKGAVEDANPYDEYTPSIPSGESISIEDPKFDSFEEIGLEQLKDTCFVLVAGGLGERLGYSSIKIGIPLTGFFPDLTFIKYYCDYILSFEERIRKTFNVNEDWYIPFCIMTSDDTHERTVELMNKENFFKMRKGQIIFVKQGKVPAMIDVEGNFALSPDGLIDSKPHGHGDVHTLVHQYSLTKKWVEIGKKWVVFFQDTNPLSFRCLPSFLYVSKTRNFDMNSVTVARKPGEAMGAICKMTHDKNGKSLIINVEYNQLNGPLKRKWNVMGDIPNPGGDSYFPGNANILALKLETYNKVLNETGGCVSEFVNPKYKNAEKTVFKSPTRLECMMQDFPKLLPENSQVGFTKFDRYFCFAAVKNNLSDAAIKQKTNLPPDAASTCEEEFYFSNIKLLEHCGVMIEPITNSDYLKFGGVSFPNYPKIVLMPSFAVTLKELKSKIKGKWAISKHSALILEGSNTYIG